MVQQFFVSNVFVPFFCVEHGFLKIDLPNMGIYHQKNAWNALFSCFFKILVHVFSSLRFADAWNMFFTRTTRHFNNRKLLFLFQMTKHAPTFLCFQCFVPFFVLNMDVSKSTCQIWPFISKKMLNMYLFHANVCSFYKRNMSCESCECECQSVHILWTLCCIPMDSIDSLKFLMRIILVSYFGGLCFNRPFVFPSFRTGDGDILAQVSQDGDRQWQAQF